MITLIAAVALNDMIGKDNDLLWKIKEDMRHFKQTTLGHIVIMGRKTFESLGKVPLPGRINLVVSASYAETPVDIPPIIKPDTSLLVYKDINSALEAAELLVQTHANKEIFIIGGGQIYEQTISIADRLVISRVQETIEGDVMFPKIDPKMFSLLSSRPYPDASVPFVIETYVRKHTD